LFLFSLLSLLSLLSLSLRRRRRSQLLIKMRIEQTTTTRATKWGRWMEAARRGLLFTFLITTPPPRPRPRRRRRKSRTN
jgi:hypothetical protein